MRRRKPTDEEAQQFSNAVRRRAHIQQSDDYDNEALQATGRTRWPDSEERAHDDTAIERR